MPWQIVDADLPDSPKYTKQLWVMGVDEKRPTKVEMSYLNLNEEPQNPSADSSTIYSASTLPLPASAGATRLYRVEFPGSDRLKFEAGNLAGLTSEGDFVAIDVTITNSMGTQTVFTLQRLYLPVEDPTI